jgi:hypothetical protein
MTNVKTINVLFLATLCLAQGSMAMANCIIDKNVGEDLGQLDIPANAIPSFGDSTARSYSEVINGTSYTVTFLEDAKKTVKIEVINKSSGETAAASGNLMTPDSSLSAFLRYSSGFFGSEMRLTGVLCTNN